MNGPGSLVFKVANEDSEFEQIHRLNYETFVEEIPQHQPSPTRRLVDKFHAENTYLICLSDRQLVGMLAVRAQRPFSLEQKLPSFESHLPPGRSLCEVRLLAVAKAIRGARGGQVLRGILDLLWQYGVERGYDLALISGTTRQLKLYRHLGFVPFGSLVGSAEAPYQPMYLTLESFEAAARDFLRASPLRTASARALNFLPGPVTVSRAVQRAFEQAPESHRSQEFKSEFEAATQRLCELVHAKRVEVLMGSGTLANDVVGAQLSLLDHPGLVISNGEFGDRLVDQARRFSLKFETVSFPWGRPVDLAVVCRKLAEANPPAWLWCVHCETSTGLLCDLEALKTICAAHSVKLCLDCISSIGTLPVDLQGVHFATCSSGKGLRAYPGLAMVFHHHEVAPAPSRLPRYLDLGLYAQHQGIPFTFSSNLLVALHAAVRLVDWPRRFAETATLSQMLRFQLEKQRFNVIGSGAKHSPAVVTLQLAAELNSLTVGGDLQQAGFLVSYNSDYLRERNWIQICLMSGSTPEEIHSLLNVLSRVTSR